MARPAIRPASFSPPPLPEASRPPAWILLDKKAYIARRENATTASCPSSGGDIVEVSFCLADPPAISHLCVHCPGLEGRAEGGFFGEPIVAHAEGAFVLFEVSFNFGPRAFSYDGGIRDYFVYKAGPGKPSLRCLPDPFPRDIKPWEVGILSRDGGDGNGGFVVAALVPDVESEPGTRPPFDLHLYSSSTGEWSTLVPRLDPSCEHSNRVLSHLTSKVIVVGGGFLGWVDLWRGVLLCDVLADDPVVRLIPLPKPIVARAWKSNPGVIRDVTSDGNNLLSFVEIQFPKSACEDRPPSYWDMSISDSDSDSDSDTTTGSSYVTHGWRATTWKKRLLSSDDHWTKDCTAESADIMFGDPTCFHLLPELWDVEAAKLTLKNLDCSAPVLSIHDDGVVYMMSELKNTSGQGAWVAAFDVRRNRLKGLAPFPPKRTFGFENTCSPCSFSKYLSTPPGEAMMMIAAKYITRELFQPCDFFILVLLSLRDQLSKFERTLVDESRGRPLLHSTRASSLRARIEVVARYAPRDGQDKALCEAVRKCMRVLKDLESWMVLKSKNGLPASIDVLRSKLCFSLAAINSLLQTLSSTAEGTASACLNSGVDREERFSVGLGAQLGAISIC